MFFEAQTRPLAEIRCCEHVASSITWPWPCLMSYAFARWNEAMLANQKMIIDTMQVLGVEACV